MNDPNDIPTNRRRRTLAQRVSDDLRRKIDSGELSAGAWLPGRRQLAEEYEVAVVTVEQAIKCLVAEGLLRAEAGRGTFVEDSVRAGIEEAGKLTAPRVWAQSPLQGNEFAPAFKAHLSSPRIGIVVDLAFIERAVDLTQSHTYGILVGVERGFSEMGVSYTVQNLSPKNGSACVTKADAARMLVESGVDAIVCVQVAEPEAPGILAAVQGTGVPCVMAAGVSLRTPALSVCFDNRDAGYQAANHLIRRGCDRLVFFSSANARWIQDRLGGVRDAAAAAGFSRDAFGVCVMDNECNFAPYVDNEVRWQETASYDLAKETLKKGLPGTGIVADNDFDAFGFLRAAEEAGFRAGRDYAIIGFDDLPRCRLYELTSLYPPLDAMGREAAKMALEALEGKISARRLSLHCSLIPRQSSNLARPAK